MKIATVASLLAPLAVLFQDVVAVPNDNAGLAARAAEADIEAEALHLERRAPAPLLGFSGGEKKQSDPYQSDPSGQPGQSGEPGHSGQPGQSQGGQNWYGNMVGKVSAVNGLGRNFAGMKGNLIPMTLLNHGQWLFNKKKTVKDCRNLCNDRVRSWMPKMLSYGLQKCHISCNWSGGSRAYLQKQASKHH